MIKGVINIEDNIIKAGVKLLKEQIDGTVDPAEINFQKVKQEARQIVERLLGESKEWKECPPPYALYVCNKGYVVSCIVNLWYRHHFRTLKDNKKGKKNIHKKRKRQSDRQRNIKKQKN